MTNTNTALIVLDYIKGITKHVEPFLKEHHTFEHVNQLVAYARQQNDLIIFVKVGFSDNYVELAKRSPLFIQNIAKGAMKLSEADTEFDPRLDYQQGDIVVVKHRINAFYSTSLEAILNANDIKNLILCGVSTNLAVEGTARDAHDRNYNVTVAVDACATYNNEMQEHALAGLKLITNVKTTKEIIG